MQKLTSVVSSFDDLTLWRNFRNGEQGAFDRIYCIYAPVLYNYGMQLVNDKDLVKDSMHDLFVYLWQKRDRLSNVTSLKGYLLISFKRKLTEERSKNAIRSSDTYSYFIVDIAQSHEDGMIAKELEKERLLRLQTAFFQLTGRQKEAIFLRFHENLEYNQIAEILGLKDAKNARTLIYRSLTELKKSLTKKDIDLLQQVGEQLWLLPILFSMPNF